MLQNGMVLTERASSLAAPPSTTTAPAGHSTSGHTIRRWCRHSTFGHRVEFLILGSIFYFSGSIFEVYIYSDLIRFIEYEFWNFHLQSIWIRVSDYNGLLIITDFRIRNSDRVSYLIFNFVFLLGSWECAFEWPSGVEEQPWNTSYC